MMETPPPLHPLTEHMDVSLGDGVEAAAGQQDHVRLGFCHRVLRVLLVRSRTGPVRCRSRVVLCSGSRSREGERGRWRLRQDGGGSSVSLLKRHSHAVQIHTEE